MNAYLGRLAAAMDTRNAPRKRKNKYKIVKAPDLGAVGDLVAAGKVVVGQKVILSIKNGKRRSLFKGTIRQEPGRYCEDCRELHGGHYYLE